MKTMPAQQILVWSGQYSFALRNLILKDFRIRYRNMSLGVFWSLLNPLVMMGVLTFVFTKLLPNPTVTPIFLLCGLVPFNFFTTAWIAGTSSIVDNAGLVKRVPFPREIIPVASVLSNTLHLIIQIALLLAMALVFGRGANIHWLWLPLVWAFEVILVSGLALIFSGLNVYTRDVRYVVESASTLLFWLVPIVYSFPSSSQKFTVIYNYNPLAAVVFALRFILLEGIAPPASLMWRLAGGSILTLAFGFAVFRRLKRGFYNYL
jgi:ABC-type polysaccharide/polyol phosphate export permease